MTADNFKMYVRTVTNKETGKEEPIFKWDFHGEIACLNSKCNGTLMKYRCKVMRNCRISFGTIEEITFLEEYKEKFSKKDKGHYALVKNFIDVYQCPVCHATHRILPPFLLPNKRYCVQDICASVNKGRRPGYKSNNERVPFTITHVGLIMRWMLAVLTVSEEKIKNYQHDQQADYTYLEGLLAYILMDWSKQEKVFCVRNVYLSMTKRDILQSIKEQGGSLCKLEDIFQSMQMTILELMPILK